MYNTPVPLPPKKCVSVFMFFDVIAKSESNVKSMPKVVHAKLTTIKGVPFLNKFRRFKGDSPGRGVLLY